MTLTEFLSTSVSVLALIVSIITAYRTFFTRFKPDVYVKPRIILDRFNKTPTIVLSCEISNPCAQAGVIDDVVLYIKYRQQTTHQSSAGMTTHIFLPALICDEYNIFKIYQESDFEPFQSIAISAGSRLTKYIVFTPSNANSFSPSAGEIELQLFSRISQGVKWHKTLMKLRVQVDEDAANAWRNPDGKNLLVEAIEHNLMRERLMEQIIK